MRLFIAIDIPNNVKAHLTSIHQKICDNQNKVRFVKTEQMHLTLKFLGEVLPDKVENIKKELKKVKFNPFTFYLDSIGIFPNENYIRVVWAGLKPENEIMELQKDIDEKLKKFFKKDKKFKPHITLTRVRFIEDNKKFMEKLKIIKIEDKKIDVDNFKLIRSNLSPKGATYETIELFEAQAF